MQRRSIRRLFQLFLLLSLCLSFVSASVFALQADTGKHAAMRHRRTKSRARRPMVGQPAPPFETRTLEGKAFNNASLEGSVALIQFWTTGCAKCVTDQEALDDVDHRFFGQDVVVIAINEGESAATVNKYLREHPRTSRIALDPKKELARRFAVPRYPFYVVIDRRGRIAAAEPGQAGEQGLLLLLEGAGVRQRPKAQQSAAASPRPGAAPAAAGSTGETKGTSEAIEQPKPATPPKIIEVPQEINAAPAKPVPRTIFVLTNGERIESDRYTVDADTVQVIVDGRERTFRTNELDIKATEAANRERGVEFRMPTRGREMVIR
jgi:peroxiredoxin